MDYAKIVRPVAGVQVIDNIQEQPGVSTIEGEIGPLIFGDSTQTYFLDIPAGAFLDQHPHPFEGLIYAVRGSFVVSSLARPQRPSRPRIPPLGEQRHRLIANPGPGVRTVPQPGRPNLDPLLHSHSQLP